MPPSARLAHRRGPVALLIAVIATTWAACALPTEENIVEGFQGATEREPTSRPSASSAPSGSTSAQRPTGRTGRPAPTATAAPPPAAPTGTGSPQGPQSAVASSVSPSSATVGQAGPLQITLNGSRFATGAQVTVDGAPADSTFVSETVMQVSLPSARLQSAGSLQLAVVNQGAPPSNSVTFTVANPTNVTLSSISPNTVTAGRQTPLTVTVTGSGFVQGSTVRVDGAAVNTTYTSATSLTASIPESVLRTPGDRSISVANPGGIVSLPSTLQVTNGAPAITTYTPTSVAAGSGAFVLTIDGRNFSPSSDVVASNQVLATRYVSSTRLTVTIPSNFITQQGLLVFYVRTPAPGGGRTGNYGVNVTAPQITCQYACADYSYTTNECRDGYLCQANGCLVSAVCGGTTPTCQYRCADYGYSEGVCYQGWYCGADGCLVQRTCN